MYLEVQPSGSKYWRLKYRHAGKEKRLALGVYPSVSLRDARLRRDEARQLIADGIDPSAAKRAAAAAHADQVGDTFAAIALEWHSRQVPSWTEGHARRVKQRLQKDLIPTLGHRPVAEITPPELLTALRMIEDRGAAESSRRALNIAKNIFSYAIATGRAERNPAPDLAGALQKRPKTQHRAAMTDPDDLGGLLRAIDDYRGSYVVKCSLKLAPLTFVRPGELRQAEWSEIDLEKAEWNIPAQKMKMSAPHLVPLSAQAVKILQDIQPLTGRGKYVFPSARSADRAMSDNAILSALRRMGFERNEMSGHGFRAVARTLLDEALGYRPDYIEHQLAHAVRDSNGRAYNRTAFIKERRAMMQTWADFLDKLKAKV